MSWLQNVRRAFSFYFVVRRALRKAARQRRVYENELMRETLNKLTYEKLRQLYQLRLGGWYRDRPTKEEMIERLLPILSPRLLRDSLLEIGEIELYHAFTRGLESVVSWEQAYVHATLNLPEAENHQASDPLVSAGFRRPVRRVEIQSYSSQSVEANEELKDIVSALEVMLRRFLSRHAEFSTEKDLHNALLLYLEGFLDRLREEFGAEVDIASEQPISGELQGRVDLEIKLPSGGSIGIELKNQLKNPDRVIGQLYKYRNSFNILVLFVAQPVDGAVRDTILSFAKDVDLPLVLVAPEVSEDGRASVVG